MLVPELTLFWFRSIQRSWPCTVVLFLSLVLVAVPILLMVLMLALVPLTDASTGTALETCASSGEAPAGVLVAAGRQYWL